MKIAVTSMEPTLESYVGMLVNRCEYVLVVDSETMKFEVFRNPIVSFHGHASEKLFAQLLWQRGADVLLVGSCGPEKDLLAEALYHTGIRVYCGMNGSVRGTVEQFQHIYYSKQANAENLQIAEYV